MDPTRHGTARPGGAIAIGRFEFNKVEELAPERSSHGGVVLRAKPMVHVTFVQGPAMVMQMR